MIKIGSRQTSGILSKFYAFMQDALHFRLQIAWETISDISRGRANKASKLKLDSKMDILLDITVCQCEIEVCQGPSNTYKCFDTNEYLGHISCTCPKEIKLPSLECKFT